MTRVSDLAYGSIEMNRLSETRNLAAPVEAAAADLSAAAAETGNH